MWVHKLSNCPGNGIFNKAIVLERQAIFLSEWWSASIMQLSSQTNGISIKVNGAHVHTGVCLAAPEPTYRSLSAFYGPPFFTSTLPHYHIHKCIRGPCYARKKTAPGTVFLGIFHKVKFHLVSQVGVCSLRRAGLNWIKLLNAISTLLINFRPTV